MTVSLGHNNCDVLTLEDLETFFCQDPSRYLKVISLMLKTRPSEVNAMRLLILQIAMTYGVHMLKT